MTYGACNRAVFITGAAAGIGRATALTFARNGYTVGGYDIDEVGLKSLADEIDGLGGTAHHRTPRRHRPRRDGAAGARIREGGR